MLKKLLRLPIQIFVFVIFIVILILGLAQLQIVKDKIRDILVSELNKSLNGQVYIAQVNGNFLNYIELTGVVLKIDNDYIFQADGATVKLNPFALINNKIVVYEFRLINPNINLKKTNSGKWNFELISKGEPDTTTSKSNLSFNLSGIEIINGTLKFDSNPNNSVNNGTTFNPSKFNLEVLNLSLDLQMSESFKQIEIGHLSFIQDRQNVLKELSGKFTLDKKGIKIDTLNIEYNKMYLAMSAFLKDVDIDNDTLSLEKLRDKNIGIDLTVSKIDAGNLRYFVPQVDMLNGDYNINLAATGTLRDLYIKKLDIQTQNSTLKLNGNILNIHNPDDMKFDIKMSESIFDLSDLRNNLLPLDLPDYSAAGKVKLNLTYTGKPNVFESDIDIEGNFGKLKGKVNLDLESKIPKYKVNLLGSALNLQPFLGNAFDSRLNCKIIGSGSGFSVNETNSEMDIEIDSSRFLHQPIDRSKISVTFINKHCNALIAFSGGNTKIGLNTEFNLNKKSDQSYNFNLSINNLDLSKFTNDPNLSSNINISSAINGKYFSIDKTSGQALIYIFPSRFKNDSIPELSFNIKYDQSDSEDRRVSIYSEIADLELKGKYTFESITGTITSKLNILAENISYSLPFPKERMVINNPVKLKKQWLLKKKDDNHVGDSIDLDYSIHLKKPDLIKNYLKCKEINTNIKIDGKLKSGINNFMLSGTANVDNLFYLSDTNSVLIQDLNIDYSFSSPVSENILFNMNNNILIKMPTAYYNKIVLNKVKLKLVTIKNQSDISLNGNFDTKTDFALQGRLTLGELSHELEFSKVNLKHSNYEWQNKDKISCSIRSDGFDIQSLTLAHADEEIILEGSISKEGEQNLSLLINNLRIENILALTSTDSLEKTESFLSGKLNIRGEIFGNAKDPLMNLYIKTDSFSTKHKYLGSLYGNIHYEEAVLYTNLQFQSSGIDSLKKSDLLLIGTVPINLSITGNEPLYPVDEEIDMYLITNKLPLRLASLIIPEFENVTGNADVNIHIFGTGNAPEVEGYLTMNRGFFTLEPNGMTYITQGRVDITTKDIKMAMSIENLPSDRKDGRLDITGLVKMVDLKIDDINISAKGQLQVLQKEKRKSNKELYGDLFIGMTGDGIKYTQNFTSKTGNILTGNIIVKDANLVLPLSNSGGSASLTDEYRLIIIDDTTKFSADSNVIRKTKMKREYEKYISEKKELAQPSPINKLGFRFDIKTLGNVKIEIPMDPLYGEALVAELGGTFTLVKSGQNIEIYGSAEIGEKSYYKFATKKFAASGNINFTGSLDNPELNIKATYEGTHINKEDNFSNQKDEAVIITITMGGTLAKPSPKYEMTVDGKIRDKGDVFGDIISFILTGSFNDEMTSNQKQTLAAKYESSLYSIGSGVISGKLTEFFKNEFEFIRSVETDYSGGELTRTNVKISGEIGNTAIFRFGGKVFSDINNANINLELPVGKILNNESLRNLIFEIYRNTSESTKSQNNDIMSIIGTRIFYRINF